MTDTVAAWGQGHNPDGRQGSGQGDDLPPDLFSKVLRGEISPMRHSRSGQSVLHLNVLSTMRSVARLAVGL